jgi:hypothetical protein
VGFTLSRVDGKATMRGLDFCQLMKSTMPQFVTWRVRCRTPRCNIGKARFMQLARNACQYVAAKARHLRRQIEQPSSLKSIHVVKFMKICLSAVLVSGSHRLPASVNESRWICLWGHLLEGRSVHIQLNGRWRSAQRVGGKKSR